MNLRYFCLRWRHLTRKNPSPIRPIMHSVIR